jgi:hypothetical protein
VIGRRRAATSVLHLLGDPGARIGAQSAQTRESLLGSIAARGRRVRLPTLGGGFLSFAPAGAPAQEGRR